MIKSISIFIRQRRRLKILSEIPGIHNVENATVALESMKQPVVWIVGGKDNGNDYTEIEELVKKKVKAIVCLGVDNHKIIDFFKDKKTEIYDTSSMQKAVEVSKSIAEKGDVVLLSPCCASFDLFNGYEDGGNQFKKEVLEELTIKN